MIRATEAFYKTFQVAREETIGFTIHDLGNGQWRLPELRRLLEMAVVWDVPFRDLEIIHDFPQIGLRTMRLNARRIRGVDAGSYTLLLAIEDVTERKEAAEVQYRRLFESAKDGIIVLESPSGVVVDVNPFFLELSRYPRTEIVGKRFSELGHSSMPSKGAGLYPKRCKKEQPVMTPFYCMRATAAKVLLKSSPTDIG